MAFEKYTVEQFMSAWFNGDTSVMSEDEFKIVYSEYVDSSGLYMSEDFERQGFIHNLNERINYVRMFLRLQRSFIVDFGKPFINSFDELKEKYGYWLKWNDDLEDFEKQLERIEQREKTNELILEDKITELERFRKKNKNQKEDEPQASLKKSRESFIRMLNSLGKIGYKLDKKVTTVEELALMIKQQLEEQEKTNG